MTGGIRYVVALGVGLCSGLIVGTAGAQGMIGPSLAEAQKALAATEAAAIEMGVGLSCAVVDSRGALVALARMDDARYGCVATSGLRRQDGPPLASTVPGPPSCPATIRSNGASSNPPSSSSAFGGTCGMP